MKTNQVVAGGFVTDSHSKSATGSPREIGPSVKGIDAVSDQRARRASRRLLNGLESGLICFARRHSAFR